MRFAWLVCARGWLGLTAWAALTLTVACGGDSTGGGSTASGGSGGIDGMAGHGGATTSVGGSGGQNVGGAGGAPIECPGGGLVPGEQTFDIDFDGKQRSYDVQIPLSYDGTVPVPLLFDIHGYGSDNWQQELISGMNQKAEDEGFIVVRPAGYGVLKSWNGGGWCCGEAQAQDLDDVGLIKAIVQEVSAIACIDPKRVYSTGISNGGALSHRLACEAADVFAAVAPVSYPLDIDPFDQCQPSRPISVMHFHGTGDLLVPYDGGLNAAPTPLSFEYWGQVNGCTDTPELTYSKGSSVCETYDACDAGVEVTLCTLDGSHVLYTNADSVPIADLAWNFLLSHTLP